MSISATNGQSFSGWDNADEIDLFAVATVDEATDPVIEPAKPKDAPPTDPAKPVDTVDPAKKPVVEDLFAQAAAEEEEVEGEEEELDLEGKKKPEEDKDKPKVPSTVGSMAMLEALKAKGLVTYELEEGVELDDNIANDILEDSYEERFEAVFDDKMKELDPAVKNIVKYAMNGGNVNDLLGKMIKPQGITITEDMDLGDEKNQLAIVKRDRLDKNEDPEAVQDYLDYLKESGKLKGIAEKLHPKFVDADKNLAKNEAKALAERRREEKETERTKRDAIQEKLKAESNINGITFSKQDERIYPSYIAEANVQLSNGKKITGLHRDLLEALKDDNKTLLLAKVLKENFDFKDFKVSERSKQVKDIKDNLQNSKSGKAPVIKRRKRSLAETFD